MSLLTDLIHFVKSTDGVIRIIGFLLLVAVSLVEFIPLLQSYRYSNVATRITIIGQNESVKPPPIALRVPWQSTKIITIAEHLLRLQRNETTTIAECSICDRLEKHSWNVWSDLDYSFVNGSSEELRRLLSIEIMTRLLNEDHDLSGNYQDASRFWALNSLHSDWNSPLIEAVWDFLDCLRYMDALVGDLDALNETTTSGYYWCVHSDLAGSYLVDKSRMERLYERMMQALCLVMRIQDVGVAGSTTMTRENYCQRMLYRVPSLLFSKGFQFSLPMYTFDQGRMNVLVTSTGKYGVQEALADPYKGFYLFSDTDFISWPPSSTEFSDHILHATKEIGDVVVGYQIDATVVEERDGVTCYHESSPVICKSNCMVEKIAKDCSCIPFTFRNHQPFQHGDGVASSSSLGLLSTKASTTTTPSPPTMSPEHWSSSPYCNTSMYEQCGFDKKRADRDCNAECTYPCEHVSYQWHTVQIATKRQWREYNLTLHPIATKYIQFSVTAKDTRAQFLSQVGGVLNLYLGVSGLTLVGFAALCGEALRRRRRRRFSMAKKEDDNKSKPSVSSVEPHELTTTPANVSTQRRSDEQQQSISDLRTLVDGLSAKVMELEEKLKSRPSDPPT